MRQRADELDPPHPRRGLPARSRRVGAPRRLTPRPGTWRATPRPTRRSGSPPPRPWWAARTRWRTRPSCWRDPDAAVRYWAAVGLGASARVPCEVAGGPPRRALGPVGRRPHRRRRRPRPPRSPRIGRTRLRHSAGTRDRRWHEAAPADEPETDAEGQADLDAALAVLQKELRSDDLDATLLACRTIELLGERARPAAGSMRATAARFDDAEGDQALFIRFSTSAFPGPPGTVAEATVGRHRRR